MRGLALAVLLAIACISGSFLAGVVRAAPEEKKEWTIKQVMELAHKSKLLNKVAAGKASEDEAKRLLTLYQALGANRPPQGSVESWRKKTDALIEAAQAVVDGKERATQQLAQTANCANCHKEHKP